MTMLGELQKWPLFSTLPFHCEFAALTTKGWNLLRTLCDLLWPKQCGTWESVPILSLGLQGVVHSHSLLDSCPWHENKPRLACWRMTELAGESWCSSWQTANHQLCGWGHPRPSKPQTICLDARASPGEISWAWIRSANPQAEPRLMSKNECLFCNCTIVAGLTDTMTLSSTKYNSPTTRPSKPYFAS